jgi:FdhD protein
VNDPRRPGPSVRTRVREHRDSGAQEREDRLVAEEPLELRLDAPGAEPRRAWVTMRTPGHDFELAAGFVVHEGWAVGEDLLRVAYCTDEDLTPEEEFNVVTVTLADAAALPDHARHAAHTTGSSACGVCGKESVAEVLRVPRAPRWAGGVPGPDVVRTLPARLREAQALFGRTGGAHAAALVDPDGTVLLVREDVGRHNAVDKVTGARVLAGQGPAAACLVVSGRAGFELVQKAVAAGVGSFVAVGAPSALAVRLASEAGLPLYGFAAADRCVQYA